MRKLVITVHGIRTFGQWQERLERLVRANAPDVHFENYHYGYFSVISFIIPIFRWLATRSFRNRLLKLMEKFPDAEISIVSHSFGTHLVGWGLLGITSDKRPRIHNVILAGSVLKSGFPWSTLLDDNSVRRVVNDCGIDDDILILSQFCVLFTGMAGRLGFVGMTSARFVNRFFSGGHSHYFESQGKSTDQFMARYWVPLITGSGEIERADERKTPGVMQGVMTTLLQIADPIKLLLYVAVIWWLLDVFFFSPYRIQVERANTAEMNVRLERSARELVRLQKEAAENKTRQVQAKVDIEAQLQSDALSKIDRVRAMAFDDKALPPSMQLSVLSNLEWLAGEYIRTDFDKSVINAAGKAFLDDYLRVLGRAGYQGDIVITARTGRPCLSRDEEYQEAEPGVEISQCATTGISKAYAMKLSQRRADAVKAYLVSRGMPANRIYTEGVGDRPVVQYPQEGLAVDWNRVARLNSRIDIVLSVGK